MSSIGKTIMAAHAEGRHFNTTTTTTKDFKMTTTTTTGKLTSVSSLSSSSSPSSSYLSITFGDNVASQLSSSSSSSSPPSSPPSSLPTIRLECCWIVIFLGILRFCFLLQKRRFEIQLRKQEQRQRQIRTIQNFYYRPLKTFRSHEGPKQKRWQALVHWDPHLFPPTHGYHLLKDRQGFHRFVKAANLLPSNKPRQFPRKLRYASTVQVKLIPHKSDPINADAWNRQFHRQVAENSRWQQQQWRLETIGKRKHRRLVVSAIAMRHFRRDVLSTLVDHSQRLQRRWAFRKIIIPRLPDHSHKLRWEWALKRHHSKAPFQECILSALPMHRQRLLLKWQAKEAFSRTVAPFLVDHSLRMRLNWALKQAQQQDQEMDNEYDDFSISSNDNDECDNHDNDDGRLRRKWALQHHHARAKFREEVLGSLESHCQSLKLRWGYKKLFRQTVVPALADHLLRMRFEWALRYADWQDREREDDDYGFSNSIDNNDTNDDIYEDDNFDDDDNVTVDTAPPPTIRPPRQRPTGIPPSTTTNGATVWVSGLRRSRRHQPMLGSIFENGRRRSARFL